MKTIWPIIAIVLAAIVILLLLFDNPKPDHRFWMDRITELETEIKAVETNRAALFNQIKKDSISGVKIQDSLKTILGAKSREVVRLKVQASKQREEVQPLIDSVPALRAFIDTMDSTVNTMDSVIVIQDQRIAVYEHQLGRLQISMGAITQSFEQNLQLERDRFEVSQQQIQVLEKENRKHKREKKGIIAIGVGLLIGSLLIN